MLVYDFSCCSAGIGVYIFSPFIKVTYYYYYYYYWAKLRCFLFMHNLDSGFILRGVRFPWDLVSMSVGLLYVL